MRSFIAGGLFAVAVMWGGDAVAGSCAPGDLAPSGLCTCPSGYKNQGEAGFARCVAIAETQKGGGSVSFVASKCKPGDLDGCQKQCDQKNSGSCVVLGRMYNTGDGVSLKDPEKAFQLFKKACDAGDLTGCVEQGRMHERGAGTPKDVDRAMKLYGRACDAKNAEGCRELAGNYFFGDGVPKDVDKSLSLYDKACNLKDRYACNRIGVIYYDGTGVPRDEAKAVKYFGPACDGGEGVACANLANAHEDGRGVPKDEARALLLMDKSCNLGYALGCNTVGLRYANGKGVAKDWPKAYASFEKACSGGQMNGCFNAGYCLENGEGLPAKDPKTASLRFEKACKGDNYEGCHRLGELYFDGRGVPQNDAKAASLYKESCDEGSFIAGCRDYGFMLYAGRGVTQNYSVSIQYSKKACDGDDGLGCFNAGFAYESGNGAEKSMSTARDFYTKSCKLKWENACKKLSTLPSDSGTAAPETASSGGTVVLGALGVKMSIPSGQTFQAILHKKDDGTHADYVRRAVPVAPALSMLFQKLEGQCETKFSPKPGQHNAKISPGYLPSGWNSRAIEVIKPDESGEYSTLVCTNVGPNTLVSAFISYGGPLTSSEFVNTMRPMLQSLGEQLHGGSSSSSSSSSGSSEGTPTQSVTIKDKPSDDDSSDYSHHGSTVHGGINVGAAHLDAKAEGIRENTTTAYLGVEFLVSDSYKQGHGIGLDGLFGVRGTIGNTFLFDSHLGLGPGLQLGPLHVAPLAGVGVDAIFGNDEKYPTNKLGGYWFYAGDVHLSLGNLGLGGNVMFTRRGPDENPGQMRISAYLSFSKYILTGQYWIFEPREASETSVVQEKPVMMIGSFGWQF